MWLAVDCGNSRVKWAMVDGDKISVTRAAALGRWAALRRDARRATEIWVSYVGAAKRRQELCVALKDTAPLHFAKSMSHQGGVINTYQPPQSLGVDRWLSLIAVRAWRRDVMIISAGTAITVDALRADGMLMGGIILPGLRLAARALAARAKLPIASLTAATNAPRNTQAAIATGAALAASGAALALRRRLLPRARIIITGGDAKTLQPWLPKMARHLPNMPINGLIQLRDMRL